MPLARLGSVLIETPEERSTEQTVNEITPRRITLSGSYDSADLFAVRHISQDAEPVVYLSRTSLGMANINYTPDTGADALARVFRPGRALRIVDDAGGVQFAAIRDVAGGDNPSIILAGTPAVEFRAGSTRRCGVRGLGNDFANVVSIIRYDLRNLAASDEFAAMYRGGPSYDGSRTELVREELDVGGDGNTAIAGTRELIAEYAVDLGFSLLVAPSLAGAGLTRLDGDQLATYAGDPRVLGAVAGPQLIRAVRAWLSVRSQEADRSTALPPLTIAAPGPTQLRISLDATDPEKPPFARVRTLQATIPLTNQARITWQ
jgi:hypothetical protein